MSDEVTRTESVANRVFVYILENSAGPFYIGHSDDPVRRLRQHNEPVSGLGKYTHKAGPWKLVWTESHATRSQAMVRERQIKAWKSATAIRKLIAEISRRVPTASGLITWSLVRSQPGQPFDSNLASLDLRSWQAI